MAQKIRTNPHLGVPPNVAVVIHAVVRLPDVEKNRDPARRRGVVGHYLGHFAYVEAHQTNGVPRIEPRCVIEARRVIEFGDEPAPALRRGIKVKTKSA